MSDPLVLGSIVGFGPRGESPPSTALIHFLDHDEAQHFVRPDRIVRISSLTPSTALVQLRSGESLVANEPASRLAALLTK